jgi:hypothetical protein
MKLILYYISLIVFLALITGFLISQNRNFDTMGAPVMFGIVAVLLAYALAISLVGEGLKEDEQEISNRRLTNRIALIVGASVLAIGVIFQFLVNHYLDYWLITGLVAINLSKIISLIYLNNKKSDYIIK